MTDEELMKLTKQVWPDFVCCDLLPYYSEELKKLIELVVKYERAACAMTCEENTGAWTDHDHNAACMGCADTIRARSKL